MKVLILAAGKGSRLHCQGSALPKVLHLLEGKPLIRYVTEKLPQIPPQDLYLVVGYQKEAVIREMEGCQFVVQEEQLGTGHAVACARDALQDYQGDLLVLYGDMPLFRASTYRALMETHQKSNAAVTLLTCDCTDRALPYGRVVRDGNGSLLDIIEERDCTPEQKKLTELNVGVYVFRAPDLFRALSQLRCDNAQKEYYLTDVPKIMQKQGLPVETYTIRDSAEILGVNTPEDLELCARLLPEILSIT